MHTLETCLDLDRRDPSRRLRGPVRPRRVRLHPLRRQLHGRDAGGGAGADPAGDDGMLARQEPAGVDERGVGGTPARARRRHLSHGRREPRGRRRVRQHDRQPLQDHRVRVEAPRGRRRHPHRVPQLPHRPPRRTRVRAAPERPRRRGPGPDRGDPRAAPRPARPRRRHPLSHPDRLPVERTVGPRGDERTRPGGRRAHRLGPLPLGRGARCRPRGHGSGLRGGVRLQVPLRRAGRPRVPLRESGAPGRHLAGHLRLDGARRSGTASSPSTSRTRARPAT